MSAEQPAAYTELVDLRKLYSQKFSAIVQALGYASEAQTWLVNDGVESEGMLLLSAAIEVLRDG